MIHEFGKKIEVVWKTQSFVDSSDVCIFLETLSDWQQGRAKVSRGNYFNFQIFYPEARDQAGD